MRIMLPQGTDLALHLLHVKQESIILSDLAIVTELRFCRRWLVVDDRLDLLKALLRGHALL